MAYAALEEMVGYAIIDRSFRADLLNDHRDQVLSQFDLTQEEQQALMNIRAESLESFAGQLFGWMEAQRPSTPRWQTA